MKKCKDIYNYEFNKNLLSIILIGIMAVLITLQSRSSIISDGASAIDSSVFRYIAYAMKNGQTMYVDTFDHKGPLIYIINYVAMCISFKHGVWILGSLAMFVTFFFSYRSACLFVSRKSAIMTVFFVYSLMAIYYEGGNLTEDWALPFITISIYLFLQYMIRGNTSLGKIFLCGLCCAVVIFLRINMIAVWGVFSIYLMVSLCLKKELKELFKFFFVFLGGVLSVTIPIFAYLWYKGAISEFFNQYILFNLIYQKSDLWRRYDIIIYYLSKPIVYISACSYIFLWHKRKVIPEIKKIIPISIVSILCFFISLLAVCQSGHYYLHYAMILLPNLVFPISIFMEFIVRGINKKNVNTNIIFYIILFYCMTAIGIPNWINCIQNIQESQKAYDFYTEDIINNYILKMTQPDDPISVVGTKNYIYLRSNRLSASKYSYQFPITAVDENIFKEYLEDLQEVQPKVIIWTNRDAKGYDKYFEELENFLQLNGYDLIEQSEYFLYTKNV